MAGWTDVSLVLAGSAGPLVITVFNHRASRRLEAEQRMRADRGETRALYAEFLASAAQINADWQDYATFKPATFDDECELDQRRDAHYAELNLLAARMRLTAPPTVRAAAEEVLEELRACQALARRCQRGAVTPEDWSHQAKDFVTARDAFLEAARASV